MVATEIPPFFFAGNPKSIILPLLSSFIGLKDFDISFCEWFPPSSLKLPLDGTGAPHVHIVTLFSSDENHLQSFSRGLVSGMWSLLHFPRGRHFAPWKGPFLPSPELSNPWSPTVIFSASTAGHGTSSLRRSPPAPFSPF